MSKKYITSRVFNVSCVVNGNVEMKHLRAGATLIYDETKRAYVVENPISNSEREITVDESTFNSLKQMKGIVSPDVSKSIKAANTGNNIQLEKKVIDLATENSELKERVEELEKELETAKHTISSLMGAAANQQDSLDEDEEEEDEIPDYNSMSVKELKAICDENQVNYDGLNKAQIVEALISLHYEESDEQ